jgi:hypothetical protein
MLAAAAIVYLLLLPSDPARAVIGRYSWSRLILVGGPGLFAIGCIAVLIGAIGNRARAAWLADRLFRHRAILSRLDVYALGGSAAFFALLLVVRPEWLQRLNSDHVLRVLPHLILPFLVRIVHWLAGELMQPAAASHQPNPAAPSPEG